MFGQNATGTFPLVIHERGCQLWLEVSYAGDGNPPWYGSFGKVPSVTNAVQDAARRLLGAVHVSEGYTTDRTLRLIVTFERGTDLGNFKLALERAVLAGIRG